MPTTVGIVFGGRTPEHHEVIKAARSLRKYALNSLEGKYRFKYFYMTKYNEFVSAKASKDVLDDRSSSTLAPDPDRINELKKCDAIYSLLMGCCGENGNIMGLADILQVPMIGCGILASALALDKHLSKVVASSDGIPVVDYLHVHEDDDVDWIASQIKREIGYPCFVKPTNLGTCAYIFRANDEDQFRKEWRDVIEENKYSTQYLIEKFIPNVEIRVFAYQDKKGKLHLNDQYATTLIEKALKHGGGLFDHVDNRLLPGVNAKIADYAKRIFKLFGMKDYARIDFFVNPKTQEIYFNEANTQPFISKFNIGLMEADGISYAEWFALMIKRNIK